MLRIFSSNAGYGEVMKLFSVLWFEAVMFKYAVVLVVLLKYLSFKSC